VNKFCISSASISVSIAFLLIIADSNFCGFASALCQRTTCSAATNCWSIRRSYCAVAKKGIQGMRNGNGKAYFLYFFKKITAFIINFVFLCKQIEHFENFENVKSVQNEF
jgi:hypothetical protein